MTFSEFAKLSRDEMVAHMRSNPAMAPGIRGKSKARKYELINLYEELLNAQHLCDGSPEREAVAHGDEATGVYDEAKETAPPAPPVVVVTRPVVVKRTGPRRLPHGATTAREVARARAAKRARHRCKHRKALARRRHGWANGQGHPQPYTAHDAQKGLEQ